MQDEVRIVGDRVLIDYRLGKYCARVVGDADLAAEPGLVVARVCPAGNARRQHRCPLWVGVDVLDEVEPEDGVRPIRLLVQHDQLARLFGDLATEHENGIADHGVAVARAVGSHAPAGEVLILGDLQRCITQLAQIA